MSVAGNFAAVVEVVEDAELPRQCVLVRRDVFTVHNQRRIAIGLTDVAEELVVSTVFFDNVDHVVNRIAATLKADLAHAAFHLVATHNFLGQLLVLASRLRQVHPRNRAVNQRGNIRMLLLSRSPGAGLPAGVRACSFAFAGRDQQLFSVDGERRGVPLCGDEIRGAIVVRFFEVEHELTNFKGWFPRSAA